jgi:hypothetical protein
MSLSLNLHRDTEGEIYKQEGGLKLLCLHTLSWRHGATFFFTETDGAAAGR